MPRRRRSMLLSLVAFAAIATSSLALPNPTLAASHGTSLPTVPELTQASQHAADGCDAVPGRVLVRFSSNAGRSERAAARTAVHGGSLHDYRLVPGLELVS